MFKGINAENFALRYRSGISQEYKIDNIIEIKKKGGTIFNFGKIELESKEEFERLYLLIMNQRIRRFLHVFYLQRTDYNYFFK